MDKRFAFVFPGQGSQSVGMLEGLAANFPIVEKTFAEASRVLDIDLWKLAQHGPEEELNLTYNTQPALLAAGVAVYRAWRETGREEPEMMAGHSLGEYTALVNAEALDYSAAIRLVYHRGRLMQEAVPPGKGAMAAIIGLDESDVATICEEAAEGETVAPANFNTIGQIVIAGHTAAVMRAMKIADEKGARLTKQLMVSVPSHCLLMKPAADELADYLENIAFHKPKKPVINNVEATAYEHPDDIKDALVRQLYSPVRWVDTIRYFITHDVVTIMECGPGRVLTGLNKRIDRSLKYCCLEDLHTLFTEN